MSEWLRLAAWLLGLGLWLLLTCASRFRQRASEVARSAACASSSLCMPPHSV